MGLKKLRFQMPRIAAPVAPSPDPDFVKWRVISPGHAFNMTSMRHNLTHEIKRGMFFH
jgi:hypothetical protein